ncbi:hypothetical protein AVEN_129792-1 [Araneus ventricosus]|uniref:Uncharacterized protein n=1 Tax=Araneus ventricosus TaxID=182803 RepID=A0A4Y2FLN2_ARAVE|nr:hypothetical protein AVEN_129792-1 [Araneus ventricosus]
MVWSQFRLYIHLLQKNFSILFFVIARRVVIIILAVKKVGLFCSQVCSNCQGKSYSNVESSTTDEDAYDINEEISDSSFFLEQSLEIQQQGEEEENEE